MKLISRGAEAELYKTDYLGRKALLKIRSAKPYRNKLLDEKIRRRRLKDEAAMLHRAKSAGVRTPVIYKIDEENAAILMEFVEGKRLKDLFKQGKSMWLRWGTPVGVNIGKMHENGIIHGDLTTSNILLHNKNLVFIDFGLGFFSRKTEDKAVDLLVFKKTFMATHPELGGVWKRILKGYLEGGGSRAVIGHMGKVEARARYLQKG